MRYDYTVFARCTHHPSYAHMTPYSARAMLDTDVVVLVKGCFASSENDPARERERERERVGGCKDIPQDTMVRLL